MAGRRLSNVSGVALRGRPGLDLIVLGRVRIRRYPPDNEIYFYIHTLSTYLSFYNRRTGDKGVKIRLGWLRGGGDYPVRQKGDRVSNPGSDRVLIRWNPSCKQKYLSPKTQEPKTSRSRLGQRGGGGVR